jgi:hypothetical protein
VEKIAPQLIFGLYWYSSIVWRLTRDLRIIIRWLMANEKVLSTFAPLRKGHLQSSGALTWFAKQEISYRLIHFQA